MSKIKKMTAVLLSAVMLVCMFMVPAGADSIADTAKAISSGETYSITFQRASDKYDYKIVLSEAGELKLNVTSKIRELGIVLYNTNGDAIEPDKCDVTSGSNHYRGNREYCGWNSTIEKFSGTLSYKLKKGTYYLRLVYTYGRDKGKVSFKATYPSSDTASSSKLSCITIPMKVGGTMQLSTDAGAEGITWKSSKTSVAQIDKNGKVTAKKAGTALITAALGNASVKIQITVSK